MSEPLFEAEVLPGHALSRDRAYLPGEIVVLPLSEANAFEAAGVVTVTSPQPIAKPTSRVKAKP